MNAEIIFKRDKYQTREQRLKKITSPDTFWGRAMVALGITISCTIIDTYLLYEKWYLVSKAIPEIVLLSALACAIALEIPFSYLGIVLKRYHLSVFKKNGKNMFLALAVGIFAIAFIGSFAFTIVTRDLVFTVGSASTIQNTVATGGATAVQEDDLSIMVAAIFNGVLPLLTSVTVFIASYFSYEPLKRKIALYEKERIGIQNNLIEVESAIAEADSTYFDRLVEREEERYQEEIQLIEAQNVYMKELARAILAKKMSTPEENDEIAKNGSRLLADLRK